MSAGISGRRHEWKRKPNGEIDEDAWDGDLHGGPQCGVCGEVFCSGCSGSLWDAVVAGTDPADCEGPDRRVWRLPVEPQVEAVTDAEGFEWTHRGADRWFGHMGMLAAVELTWDDLLGRGPLTEVSAEYDAWRAKGAGSGE